MANQKTALMTELENLAKEVEEPQGTLADLFQDIGEDAEVNREELSNQILIAYQAVVKGEVVLPPAELALLKDAMAKIVPSAPKHIPQESSISPEEYIKTAMEKNEACFDRIVKKSREYAAEVMIKNVEFYELVEKTL